MPKKISEFERGYANGVAIACAIITSTHDQAVAVTEVLKATGYTSRAKLKRYGVDAYDLDILRPILRRIGRRAGQR